METYIPVLAPLPAPTPTPTPVLVVGTVQAPDPYDRYRINHALGSGLYIAIGAILLIGLVGALLFALRAAKVDPDYYAESQTPLIRKRPNALKTWARQKLILPALFGGKHVQPIGWYMLPTRGQSLMIVGYFFLNILFMVVHYPMGISVKAVADRAGHLAVVNMPVYFIFAGRNNILIWVTGWPYKDFQVFHKFIARVAFFCVIVHAAGYGYKSAQKAEQGPRRKNDGRLWWNGIASMTVMAVLVLFSIHPVRRKSYELFLAIHIIGAALFLMFAFNHIAPSLHPYKRYIWACAIIWSIDRGLRFLRLIVFNRRGRHTARAKIIPGTQTIRFTVYPKIKDVGFVPSAHYFIYIPDRWCFWECHPFTAAGWRPAGPSLTQTPDKVVVALERIKTPADGSNSSNEKDAVIVTTTSASRKGPARAKLTFLISAQRGMTRNIFQRIIDSPEKAVDVPCFLEGPYGNLRPVHAFPTVIVIAGGVGISTGLPYLQQHLRRRREITRRFVLIWTVREGSLAEKVLREVRGLSFRPDVAVRIYITRSNSKDSWRMPLGVKMRYRRPLIEEMIVKEATSRVPGTPMAVISCGGGGVVDSARRGAVRALDGASGKKGMGEVVYWEEGYGH